MVEKSNIAIIVAIGFVLALSAKDIITIKAPAAASSESSDKANEEEAGKIHMTKEERSEFGDDDDSPLHGDDFMQEAETSFKETDLNDDDKDDDKDDDVKSIKKIPELKIKRNVQTIKFQFCYSCGYRNMYEQYSQLIHNRYPDINVVGENYVPPNGRAYIAQFLGTFKMVIIGFVLFGQSPFQYFNMNTPQLFTWATENKLYSTLMVFFISNAIETQLISTGAFEIFLNDVPVWSKLQSDRMPHEKEILQILDVNFNFDSAKKDAFGSGSDSFNPNAH